MGMRRNRETAFGVSDMRVPVVALHRQLRAAERRAALDPLENGDPLVVLTTPETLESAATAPLSERARGLSIDEAHWHDFRPSYLRLGAARERLHNPRTLALTATATPRVRGDIAERRRLNNGRRSGTPRQPSPDRARRARR
jgi:ATP-dependent DNA helicase RecQ